MRQLEKNRKNLNAILRIGGNIILYSDIVEGTNKYTIYHLPSEIQVSGQPRPDNLTYFLHNTTRCFEFSNLSLAPTDRLK